MIPPSELEKLIEMNSLARESSKKYPKKRFAYEEIKRLSQLGAFVGIAGVRGAGKTVLLRQLLQELPNSFYVSMDSMGQAQEIFELAKSLQENYKIKHLLIDEIHYCKNWQANLKKISDFLPIKIIFTSSSSVDIIGSKADLSRRVFVFSLPPFSFREYLYFRNGKEHEKQELEGIIADYKELYGKLYQYEPYFEEFCMGGSLPAMLGAQNPQIIRSIADKAINIDLRAAGKLDAADIANIFAMLRFISRAGAEVCSYSAIAKNCGITKYKTAFYVGLLEQASILKVLLPYGTNVMKEPKIIFQLPFRACFSEGMEQERLFGALKEEFFIHHLENAGGTQTNYLKSVRGEKLADYIVFHGSKKTVFEIGGAGKTAVQLKGVSARQKFLVLKPGDVKRGIPLILFGFLF